MIEGPRVRKQGRLGKLEESLQSLRAVQEKTDSLAQNVVLLVELYELEGRSSSVTLFFG